MSWSRRTNIFRRRRKWIRFKSHILSKRFPSQRTSTLVRMAPLRSHYIKCDRFAPRRARLQYYYTKETAQISIHNLRHSLKWHRLLFLLPIIHVFQQPKPNVVKSSQKLAWRLNIINLPACKARVIQNFTLKNFHLFRYSIIIVMMDRIYLINSWSFLVK